MDLSASEQEKGKHTQAAPKVPTYRYKLAAGMISAITQFAKIHQHDDRHTYKESWEDWCEDNAGEIAVECRRLKELGYSNDVYDKMYKAGRYYFRKKSGGPVVPQKRRVYVSLSHNMLEAMDTHIKRSKDGEGFTPASGYCDFCQDSQDTIRDEIAALLVTKDLDSDLLVDKIKKTYKNRYFIISRSA